MKYIKTPVYEFDELAEEIKDKIRYKGQEFYWDCMWDEDLNEWLFFRDDCPLKNSGVSIDSHEDLSIDVSFDRYDHCVFRECKLDKYILMEKSGADKIISRKLCATRMDAKEFIDNIDISWSLPAARDYFNHSGYIDIECIEDWEEDIEDVAYDLEEEIGECLSDYMHDLQSKLMDYLRDLSWETARNEGDNPNPDLVYDAHGTSYWRDEVEDDEEE